MHFSGFMLDSARCLENRAYYRSAIEFLSARGVNTLLWHFTDDQGCMMKFDSVPGIASPHAYSKSEMKELAAFARERGITLIPELASLGHTRYITRLPEFHHLDEIENVFTGICPVAEQTRDVLSRLLEEVMEVFDSPWIHCGMDEANIGHHPLTREALQTRTKAELVGEHINFLHGLVSKHGRTLMIWGDGLLHDREIAKHISRDIIICDWLYRAEVPAESVQYFLDEGFPVILCPAVISHGQPTFPGDQLAISNVRAILRHQTLSGKGKIIGVIVTIWQPERYMHDSLWIAIDLAAQMVREGPDLSIESCAKRFAAEFYGLAASPEWISACREIYRLMPRRGEWLAVAKLNVDKFPAADEMSARTRAWRHITEVLATAKADVRKNRDAYATFLLMVQVIDHVYRRAEMILVRETDTHAWAAMQEQGLRLISEVDAVWDRERFSDDPIKYVPSREIMRDNHLIIVLREGQEQFQSLRPKTP